MRLFSSLTSNAPRYILALAAVFTPPAVYSQAGAVDPVDGIWGAEVRFGMPVEGELTLDGREGMWRASIAGFQVAVEKNGNEISFRLPDNIAEFRGLRNAATNSIRGEWIQQGGPILDPQYASPIELHSIAPSVWRGKVVPLDQRVSVYICISSRDGKRTASVSNPEANFFRRRVYVVTREGARVSFEANGAKIEGTLDEKAGTLSLQLVNWLPGFQFTHRTVQNAVGFFPRTPFDGAAWSYREPLPEGDGWPTGSMKAVGLDQAPIVELVNRIFKADPEGTSLKIQSLLIARHGRPVLEEYFYGFDRDRVHDMRSASKTFAPVLAGLAKQHGANLAPQTPLYPLFRQYSSFAGWDARKQKVTLRDIMTMTAGNACDDNNDDSPGNEDRMQASAQRDWYRYSLDLPMVKEPGGEDAIYCSADLNLVGGAVAAATHRWIPDFFEESLARPLQFERYYLNLMPDGQAYMGGGAYLRPRDQLKLGQLYLAGGLWNGKRIVDKAWVAQSTSVHSRFPAAYSLGQKHEYGYGWHIHDLRSGAKTYRVFAADGHFSVPPTSRIQPSDNHDSEAANVAAGRCIRRSGPALAMR